MEGELRKLLSITALMSLAVAPIAHATIENDYAWHHSKEHKAYEACDLVGPDEIHRIFCRQKIMKAWESRGPKYWFGEPYEYTKAYKACGEIQYTADGTVGLGQDAIFECRRQAENAWEKNHPKLYAKRLSRDAARAKAFAEYRAEVCAALNLTNCNNTNAADGIVSAIERAHDEYEAELYSIEHDEK
jgi:hypothetical protein